MNAFVLILLCAVSVSTTTNIPRYNLEEAPEHFETFIKDYDKVYVGETEKAKRYEIFVKNLERANIMNERGGATYGITQFADLTSEEFQQKYLGFRSDTSLDDDYKIQEVIIEKEYEEQAKNIPIEYDWRTKGVVSRVKNRAKCKSSWAFSIIGSLESINAIETGNLTEFSEQQIVDCLSSADGCTEGDLIEACEYLREYGAISERDYPYEARYGKCRYDADKVAVKFSYCVPYYFRKKIDKALAVLLVLKGPLPLAIDGTSLDLYKGGILEDCNGTNLNLPVLLVGYGVDANKTRYWIVKNSWGTEWGEDGYIRLKKGDGVNCRGIVNRIIPSPYGIKPNK